MIPQLLRARCLMTVIPFPEITVKYDSDYLTSIATVIFNYTVALLNYEIVIGKIIQPTTGLLLFFVHRHSVQVQCRYFLFKNIQLTKKRR